MTVRIMSDKELSRLEVLRDLDHQRLTAAAGAELLGLGRRQVLRLLGNAIDHGRATRTLIEAGAGAYAGHEIGKNSHRC